MALTPEQIKQLQEADQARMASNPAPAQTTQQPATLTPDLIKKAQELEQQRSNIPGKQIQTTDYLATYREPVKPDFIQSVAQGIASGPLQLASNIRGIGEGFSKLGTAYNQYKEATGKSGIGNVLSDIKANSPTINKTLETYTPTKYNYDYGYLGKSSNITTPKEAVGTAANIASLYTGGGTLVGLKNVAATSLLGKALPVAKDLAQNVIAPGALTGGLGLGGQALQEGKSYTEAVKEFGKGAAYGAGGAILFGPVAGKAFGAVRNKVAPTKSYITSQIDDSIKNVYKDTTGDVTKINELAFKVKKGLDLLSQESPNIKIPDSKAPIGATKDVPTKAFNIKKATPNEFVSAVTELGNSIAQKARSAADTASKSGLKLDVTAAKNLIDNAIDIDIPKSTGNRLKNELDRLNNDPLAIHDWVQEVNTKYKKKYENNSFDTALSKLAHEVADNLRNNLDTIVDRKGYAEAFGNNQELKRMMVTAAKKANKDINWGDISSDAGVDAAFAILSGNPAYMARTFGTTLLRGMFNKLRNNSQFKNIKKAATLSKKVPGSAKMPSTEIKIDKTLKRLPAPSFVAGKAALKVKDASYVKATDARTDPRTISQSKLLPAPKTKEPVTPMGGSNVMGQKIDSKGKIVSPATTVKVTDATTDPRTSLKNKFGDEIPTDKYSNDEMVNTYLNNQAVKDVANKSKKDLIEEIDQIENGTPYGKLDNFNDYIDSMYQGRGDLVKKLVTADRTSKDGLGELLQGKASYIRNGKLKSSKLARDFDGIAEELGYGYGNRKETMDSYEYLQDVVDTYNAERSKFKDMQKYLTQLKKKVTSTNRIITEETYLKAKQELDDIMRRQATTFKSSVLLGAEDVIETIPQYLTMAAYHLESGVRTVAELGERLAKDGYKFTKEQLDNLFNTASLTNEAKKYKSAEEFVNKNIASNFKQNDFNVLEIPGTIRLTHTSPEQHIKDFSIQKMDSATMDRNFGDYFYVSNSTIPDYGDFAYNFYYPKNKVLDLTDYQKSKISDEELFKKYDVLQVAKDEFIVKDPSKLQKETKSQLTDIWNKTNKKVAVELPTGLEQEAKKYKSAEEFVKAQGEPLYHGTTRDFTTFDKTKLGEATGARSAKKGFFLTDDFGTARSYPTAENWKKVQQYIDNGNIKEAEKLENLIFNKQDPAQVKEAFAKLNNPKIIDAEGSVYGDYRDELENAIDEAVKNGNDGLIIKNLSDNADYSEYTPATHYLILDENKIITKQQLIDIYNKANKSAEKMMSERFGSASTKDKYPRNGKGEFASKKTLPKAEGYKETGNLTTKILQDLEGKSTVSKQYLLDATNRGEVKQAEKDIIRAILESEGDKVNVIDFANKVKAELLPLKIKKNLDAKYPVSFNDYGMPTELKKYRFEGKSLPAEVRGDVKEYSEHVFESPLPNKAGEKHYPGQKVKGYFAHTRLEDMADNITRRIIELQSDLYQKAKLDRSYQTLRQYDNPTAHFRVVREEIKNAAKDKKRKIQFPTGKTAFKVQDFADQPNFFDINTKGRQPATTENVKIGQELAKRVTNDVWKVKEILPNNKLKVVKVDSNEEKIFDISERSASNQAVMDFYEKDLAKYLKSKYNAELVTDDKGVSWYEVDLTKKDYAKLPVEAFSALLVGGSAINSMLPKKEDK